MLGPLLGYSFLAGVTADIPDDFGPSVRGSPPSVPTRGMGGDRALVRLSVLGRGFFRTLAGEPDSRKSDLVAGKSDSRKSEKESPCAGVMEGGLDGNRLLVGFGAGSGRDSGLCLGCGRRGRPSACGADRPVASGSGPRLAHRADLYRLALRQFLGHRLTSIWRSYFFDPRIVPLVAVAISLVVLSGCGGADQLW